MRKEVKAYGIYFSSQFKLEGVVTEKPKGEDPEAAGHIRFISFPMFLQ